MAKFIKLFETDPSKVPYSFEAAAAIKKLKLDLRPGNLFRHTFEILQEN